ncbi:MAG: hypothetical protein DMG75_15095 [Acidobacteria bacterium]|nr:MAG: hypothetical protein DMG75_15095 [Acidobacteriota bacterium]
MHHQQLSFISKGEKAIQARAIGLATKESVTRPARHSPRDLHRSVCYGSPLPSGYAVRELCNDSEGHYWYVLIAFEFDRPAKAVSRIADLQPLGSV